MDTQDVSLTYKAAQWVVLPAGARSSDKSANCTGAWTCSSVFSSSRVSISITAACACRQNNPLCCFAGKRESPCTTTLPTLHLLISLRNRFFLAFCSSQARSLFLFLSVIFYPVLYILHFASFPFSLSIAFFYMREMVHHAPDRVGFLRRSPRATQRERK